MKYYCIVYRGTLKAGGVREPSFVCKNDDAAIIRVRNRVHAMRARRPDKHATVELYSHHSGTKLGTFFY